MLYFCPWHCLMKCDSPAKFCNLIEINYFLLSRRLIQLLQGAKSSLDVCMYLITLKCVTDLIIKMHRKGVKVRIIIDADMAGSTGAQVHALRKYGEL